MLLFTHMGMDFPIEEWPEMWVKRMGGGLLFLEWFGED